METVGRLRLTSGGQLARHCYAEKEPALAVRSARRDLEWLHRHGALYRLERQIGGIRAGSTGHVYALGALGRRLLDFRHGEGAIREPSRYEPSVGFVDHALAVSEVFVGLHEHLRDPWLGEPMSTLDFRVEQQAWRSYLDALGSPAVLKPDAEVRLLRQGFDERAWLEVDRATERRAVIRNKLAALIAYRNTGHEQAAEGIFPITAWLTTSEERAAVIREVVDEFDPADRKLFVVGLLRDAVPLILSCGRSER
ncbi:MAG: replication-relaxation family protein [Patulibacter sp.]|nr:replication-relaxation family protein [Patulibacter sp.]